MSVVRFPILLSALWLLPGFLPNVVHSLCAYIGYTIVFSVLIWLISTYSVWLRNSFISNKISPEKKGVLITGCDTGFGHLAAQLLNNYGFTVFACCLNPDSTEALRLKNDCKDISRMMVMKLDVTKAEDVDAVYKELSKYVDSGLVDGLWGLVNNAGIASGFYIDWDDFDTTYKAVTEVNYLSAVRTTRKLLPLLRRAQGRVVNISSVAALSTPIRLSAYGISKAALSIFSDVLRIEQKHFGVKSVTLFPAAHQTRMLEELKGKRGEKAWSRTEPVIQADYGEKFAKESIAIVNQRWSRLNANPPDAVAKAILESLIFQTPEDRQIVAPFSERFHIFFGHLRHQILNLVL